MAISLFEIYWSSRQWWVALLGIQIGEISAHLFYIEYDQGLWKFDFLWLRPFRYRWMFGYWG